MSEGPEQRSWLGAKAPLAINALSVEISDKILSFGRFFAFLTMGTVGIKTQQLHGLGTLQGTRDPMGRGPHRGSHWTRVFQERQLPGQIMGMSDAGLRGEMGIFCL